jgi:hypothetical protein
MRLGLMRMNGLNGVVLEIDVTNMFSPTSTICVRLQSGSNPRSFNRSSFSNKASQVRGMSRRGPSPQPDTVQSIEFACVIVPCRGESRASADRPQNPATYG